MCWSQLKIVSMIIKVKKLKSDAKLPAYAYPGDAGLDLYSIEKIIVPAGSRRAIPTGLAFEIPSGYVGLVWAKSGLAFNQGLTTMSGVLDAGYRGELALSIFNTTSEDYCIEKGDKVAQLLIQPVIEAQITETEELSDSSRGTGGFGSTGKK